MLAFSGTLTQPEWSISRSARLLSRLDASIPVAMTGVSMVARETLLPTDKCSIRRCTHPKAPQIDGSGNFIPLAQWDPNNWPPTSTGRRSPEHEPKR